MFTIAGGIVLAVAFLYVVAAFWRYLVWAVLAAVVLICAVLVFGGFAWLLAALVPAKGWTFALTVSGIVVAAIVWNLVTHTGGAPDDPR